MDKETFARQLDGKEYPFNLVGDQRKVARENRLLVIYGASDDLVEIEGLQSDEYGSPCVLWISRTNGKVFPPIKGEEADVLEKHGVLSDALAIRAGAIKVEALWCEDKLNSADWSYKTDTPHATFRIMEDGGVYCRGIVLQL